MATFNRAAAKAAGYTDQEIDAHLAAYPNGPPGFQQKQQEQQMQQQRQQIGYETDQVQLQSAKIALQKAQKADAVAAPNKYLSTPTKTTSAKTQSKTPVKTPAKPATPVKKAIVKGTTAKNPEANVRNQGGNWLSNVGHFLSDRVVGGAEMVGNIGGMALDTVKYKTSKDKEKQEALKSYNQRRQQVVGEQKKYGFDADKKGNQFDPVKYVTGTGKTALEAGSWAVPAGKGVKALGKSGAVIGGMRGASEEGATLPSIGLSAAGGALAGMAIGTVAKGLRALTKGIPEKLMKTVFKEPLKDTRAAIKGGESLGKEALRRGVKGSEETILNKSTQAINHLEDNLQEALISSPKKVSTKELIKTVKPLVDEYTQSGNTKAAASILNRIAELEKANGQQIPASAANQIKRSLYDEARKAYGTEASAGMEGLKTIARGIKEQLGKIPGVDQINKDLSFYGRARDAMIDKLARGGRNDVIGLSDIGVGGVGGLAGTMTGGLPGGIAGAMIADTGKRMLGSVAGKTGLATGLSKLGQRGLPNIVTGGIERGAQIVGSKLGSVLNEGVPQNTNQPNGSYPSQNGNNPVHTQNGTLPPVESQPQSYITGHSPEELYQAYQAAVDAGDEASATALGKQYDDEVAYQKTAGGTGAKKNAKQQSFSNAANAGQKALNLLESGGVASGIGQNIIGGIGEKTGWNSEKQTDYRSTVGLARTLARNALLGANMTPRELESLSAAIPEFDDAPNIAKQKLRTFVMLMNEFSANFAGVSEEVQGIDQQLPIQ